MKKMNNFPKRDLPCLFSMVLQPSFWVVIWAAKHSLKKR